MTKLTRNIEIKTPLTNEQKEEMLKKISEARQIIEDETEALKEHRDDVKTKVETQDDIISQCISTYRKGYTSKVMECSATYILGEATFTDKDGVIVEQRPMTDSEQMMLSENRIDAESIIRQDNEENG
jgi:coenzyme F420-reducing hydrogenase alpha subunit